MKEGGLKWKRMKSKVPKVPFDEKTFPARPPGELEVQEWITF